MNFELIFPMASRNVANTEFCQAFPTPVSHPVPPHLQKQLPPVLALAQQPSQPHRYPRPQQVATVHAQ
ncbi:hypothetical protein P171DRAFT_159355 [Karstenula rhodostoma CBS 690.94]|uniref:Uncharacterized protein n=1 Tax=Karstenula rhodostoma CBS 690.94 TaxID=1392251 RepID=A0A9P4P4S5_9PLEO|nr:hypothetical protein P171DRAFT_159355 [Karstenula rhodostoma CBS 690.94]